MLKPTALVALLLLSSSIGLAFQPTNTGFGLDDASMTRTEGLHAQEAPAAGLTSAGLVAGVEPNQGQMPDGTQGGIRTATGPVFLTGSGLLFHDPEGQTIRLDFQDGGLSWRFTGDILARHTYFREDETIQVEVHERAEATLLTHTIEVYVSTGGSVEFDVVLEDPSLLDQVQVWPSGTVATPTDGSLNIGGIRLAPPRSWQTEPDGSRIPVAVRFLVEGDHIGFAADQVRQDLPLRIDPIVHSTLIGGSDDEMHVRMAPAGDGTYYLAGATHSWDHPVTGGSHDPMFGGGSGWSWRAFVHARDFQGFITRYDPTQATIPHSTFLDDAVVLDMAIGPAGDVYVVGTAGPSLPLHGNTPNGPADGFIMRLAPDLAAVDYSWFLGGPGRDPTTACRADNGCGIAIDVDAQDRAHVAMSRDLGAPRLEYLRFRPDGSVDVDWTPPSSSRTYIHDIVHDGLTGDVYVVGWTDAPDVAAYWWNATTFQPLERYNPSPVPTGFLESALVIRIEPPNPTMPDMPDRVTATFLGGEGNDRALTVAVHEPAAPVPGIDQVYIGGSTTSRRFPTVQGSFRIEFDEGSASSGGPPTTIPNPPWNGFVTQIRKDLSDLGDFSTFIGRGGGMNEVHDLDIAPDGAVAVTGTLRDGITVTPHPDWAFGTAYGGSAKLADENAFASILDPGGTRLLYSRYIGHNCMTQGNAIEIQGPFQVSPTLATITIPPSIWNLLPPSLRQLLPGPGPAVNILPGETYYLLTVAGITNTTYEIEGVFVPWCTLPTTMDAYDPIGAGRREAFLMRLCTSSYTWFDLAPTLPLDSPFGGCAGRPPIPVGTIL